MRDSQGDWWVPTGDALLRYRGACPVRGPGDARAGRPLRQGRGDGRERGVPGVRGLARGPLARRVRGRHRPLGARDRAVPPASAATGGVRSGPPSAFAEDRTGTVWAGLWPGGLARCRGDRCDRFRPGGDLPSGPIASAPGRPRRTAVGRHHARRSGPHGRPGCRASHLDPLPRRRRPRQRQRRVPDRGPLRADLRRHLARRRLPRSLDRPDRPLRHLQRSGQQHPGRRSSRRRRGSLVRHPGRRVAPAPDAEQHRAPPRLGIVEVRSRRDASSRFRSSGTTQVGPLRLPVARRQPRGRLRGDQLRARPAAQLPAHARHGRELVDAGRRAAAAPRRPRRRGATTCACGRCAATASRARSRRSRSRSRRRSGAAGGSSGPSRSPLAGGFRPPTALACAGSPSCSASAPASPPTSTTSSGLSLSRIAVLSEVASRKVDTGGAAAELADIGTTARDLVAASSDMAWSLDPRRDDLPSLLARLRRLAEDVFSGAGRALELRRAAGRSSACRSAPSSAGTST